MNLSFAELAILVNANGLHTRSELAILAAAEFPSDRFDQRVALAEIDNLLARKLLVKEGRDLTLSRTLAGQVAVLNSRETVSALNQKLSIIHLETA